MILFEKEYDFGKRARVTIEPQPRSIRKCFTIPTCETLISPAYINLYMEMEILASFRLVVLYVLAIALILLIPSARGANFLVTLFHPMGQASQNHFIGRITSGLIARGHTVTVLAANNYNFKGFNRDTAATRIITFKTTTSTSGLNDFKKAMSASQHKEASVFGTMRTTLALRDFPVQNCVDLFEDVKIMDDLRKANFDLLLLQMFVPCDALLAEHLKVPFIVMTPTFRFPAFDEDVFNIEIPSSYVPFMTMGALTDEMNFVQRVQNFLMRHVILKLMQHVYIMPYRELQLKYDIDPKSSVRELMGRAELWLCHKDFALEFPHPTAPNWILYAGLMASAETKPLPQELEDFVQGSGDHGVIVFSLGSTDMSLLTEEMNENFAEAFSEFPQRVLWKYKGPPPRTLGNNTRLLSWLPQADLLAHPKTRLLIYHGGLAGVYEAMHCKKPMVILPLLADQPAVAARVAKKGMGVVLSRGALSVKNIKSAIQEVLENPSYKANVEKYGSISMDTLASPLDTVMFWIEHIVKFGGSHLKTRAGELNFITRNSLDVIAFVLAIIILGLYIDYMIIRSCYRCMCGRKMSKPKTD